MKKRGGKGKYAVLDETSSLSSSPIDHTRWHEGDQQDKKKQHFHHLTFPNLEDIETDDSEFVDPTESMLHSPTLSLPFPSPPSIFLLSS